MAIERAMTPLDEDTSEDNPFEVQIVPDDYEAEGAEESEAPDQPLDPAQIHQENLVEYFEENDLDGIGKEIIRMFDEDEATRHDWIKTYKEGLKYLGFSMEERTKPFKGASGVFHPVMSEAIVRFQSNAIMEIFPAAGPVLTRILGDDTTQKVQQAKRVKEELNYQLTENMAEYRTETEQMLFRLPLAGSVFKKTYYDPARKRPVACMVPAEDLVVNYGYSELDSCERYFHVMRKSPNEVKKLQRSGLYRTVKLPEPVRKSFEGKEAEDKLTGMKPSMMVDNQHILIEAFCHYELPEPFNDPQYGIADPYVITVDYTSGKVLSIYRNWEYGDEERVAEQRFTHYQYMPGLGFYGVGLVHLLGSIAKASTSILRQLVDAGTLSNLPGGLKTKGLRTKGEDEPIQPGEWRDVDVPGGAIKDNLFPLPYKEPSAVLTTLLQMIVDEGRRIGSIADVEIGSSQANAPVGTTLALLERSLKVMSAVHARLHASLRRELKLISKIVSDYMDEHYDWDTEGKFNRREDFDGRVDVLPVSDPNAATQAQKIVQMQAVQQLASMNPELYNLKEVHRAGLQAIGIKNDERLLPLDLPPPRMDPVSENMAILTSQPIKVYPEQDHTAHIQVHLSAMSDPKILEMISQSPSAARLQGQMEAHVAEHLAFQYRQEIEEMMGVELPPMGEPLPPDVENHLSRLVADASVRLRQKHEAEAAKKQAEEVAADPVFQLREREVSLKERAQFHKEAKDAVDTLIDISEKASKEEMDIRRLESEESRAGAKIGADLVTFGAQLESEERRQGVTLGKEIAENIRSDQRTVQQMDQESRERAADREHQLQLERTKAANKPKPKAGKS